MDRKIIHLDMDAFFASIEERDNPELRGKPVIVGAKPNQRGVVSTCNYEARKYGVHSAMSSAEAYRRCPHAIFVTSHFDKYKEASLQVHSIMEKYTDCIEFLSLDEGYMDVTGSERFFGSAPEIAKAIQKEVFKQVGTTCSVGVGYNMLSAKLASEEKKPRGFFVIENPQQFADLMNSRPVKILYGIGEKTAIKLNGLGIKTVGDLANSSPDRLKGTFSDPTELINYAKGIDNREVTPNAPAKSIGKETTFLTDVTDISILKDTLLLLSREVGNKLTDNNISAKTVTLKIKFPNMKSITRSFSGKTVTSSSKIYKIAQELLDNIDIKNGVRLIGVSVGNFLDSNVEQLSFSDLDDKADENNLTSVLTELRHTYGQYKLKTAREMLAEKHIYEEYKKNKN